jgi:hypothetical protein
MAAILFMVLITWLSFFLIIAKAAISYNLSLKPAGGIL